jgi:hypothetical protein
MTAFVFIAAAPPPYTANDLLTIKRNGFTKVTKRKSRNRSQNRERRLEVSRPAFAINPLAKPTG